MNSKNIKVECTVKKLMENKDVIKVGTFNCEDTVCDLSLESCSNECIKEGDNLCDSYVGYAYDYYDNGLIIDKYSMYNCDKWVEDIISVYARYGMNDDNDQKIESAIEEHLNDILQNDEYDEECDEECGEEYDEEYDEETMICFIALSVMNNNTYDLFYNKAKGEYYFIFDRLENTYYTVKYIDILSCDFATKYNATASIIVGACVEQIWIDFDSEKIEWTEEYKAYLEEKYAH